MKKYLMLFLLTMFCAGSASAADKLLADRHMERLGKCEACHKTMPPKQLSSKDCLSCHGSYEKLAARTDKNDINPHDSHLEDPDCGQCHRGHKKPLLACDECHEFKNIRVP